MKKGILYVLMLLFLLSFVAASTTSVLFPIEATNIDARISIVRYAPIPVEPGQYFDLWVSLETQGSYGDSYINLKDLREVELELVESFPFTLDPSEEAVTAFGTIEQGERVTAKYRIFVDENANAGDHPLKFKFRSSQYTKDIEAPPLEITIASQDATISVSDITTNPEKLSPGQPASLSLTLRNDAAQSFRNIKAELNIDATTIPIVPYKSSKEQTIGTLARGEEYTLDYSIIAEEDAAAGVYKIPFKITYTGSNNTIFTKEDTFGLLIGTEGDIEYNLEEFDTFQKGKKGNIIVSASNVGPSELKFMTIELLPSEDYTVIGRNKEYLGNLDSDDFETSSYEIHVSSGKDIALNFLITYKDTYNMEHKEEVAMTLPVYTKNEIRAYGLDGDAKNYLTFLIYALIILFLYYTYKGWRTEKRLDKAVAHGLSQIIKLPFRILLFFRPKNLRRLPRKIRLFFSDL